MRSLLAQHDQATGALVFTAESAAQQRAVKVWDSKFAGARFLTQHLITLLTSANTGSPQAALLRLGQAEAALQASTCSWDIVAERLREEGSNPLWQTTRGNFAALRLLYGLLRAARRMS